jgi:hypothetical protein
VAGTIAGIICLGYIPLIINELRECGGSSTKEGYSTEDCDENKYFFGNNVSSSFQHLRHRPFIAVFQFQIAVRSKSVLLALMFIMMIFYACTEFAIYNFLPTFAVKSGLQLSKAEGSTIFTVFLAMYSSKRCPRHILCDKFNILSFGFFPF